MTLILTDDQQMFRDSAKRFAAERTPVSQLRKLRDDLDPTGFSREVWKEMAEMGWAGVLVPEEYGGVGFGFVGAGLIASEIGRNLSATAVAVERRAGRDRAATWRHAGAERNIAAGHCRRRLVDRVRDRRVRAPHALSHCHSLHRQVQAERSQVARARRSHRGPLDRPALARRAISARAMASRCSWSIRKPAASASRARRWSIVAIARRSICVMSWSPTPMSSARSIKARLF